MMTDREKLVDKVDVDVCAYINPHTNCLCDMCHGTGSVIHTVIPETKFFDGKQLSTKHHNWWMCESCRDKVLKAISIPFKREENNHV